jgi:predicted AAA+ superfamily ATPase
MVSLDKAFQRRAAAENPELFLKGNSESTLVVDEIQKVPELFDEIKAMVDEQRRPGRFVLSGSARFTSKIGIRESLTGRTAVLYMDSMTVKETLGNNQKTGKTLVPDLEAIHRYLRQGGMPGTCFNREDSIRKDYWDEWSETLCEQDLHAFSKGRLSGDLAFELLRLICTTEDTSSAELARRTHTQARRVQTHLAALEDLFVIYPVAPAVGSIGKSRYLPFDCGLATHMGASPLIQMQTLVHHEMRNQARLRGEKALSVKFYRHRKGAFFDFVEESSKTYFMILATPFPTKREIQRAVAQTKREPGNQVVILCATDESSFKIDSAVEVRPIHSLFFEKT